MAIKEFNVDLDVKGRVLASTVPNSTGSIVTWNTTTNVFGLRTNTQIISDLGLTTVVDNSHTHNNKSVLDGITSAKVSEWNANINKTQGDGWYEPKFSKNSAFNKNFGTTSGTVAEGNHTHTFASLTSKPTTIAGYGITDFNSLGDARWALRTRTITGTGGLTGGGNLTANRTISLSTATQNDIAKGVEAHGWGNHSGLYFGALGTNVSNLDNVPRGTAMKAADAVSQNAGFKTYGSGFTMGYNETYKSQIWLTRLGDVQYRFTNSNGEWLNPVTTWHSGNFDPSNYYTKTEGDARYALRTRTITAGTGLTGGGNLTANRSISLSTDTQGDIAKGVTAFEWGDHNGNYIPFKGNYTGDLDEISIGSFGLGVSTNATNAPFTSPGGLWSMSGAINGGAGTQIIGDRYGNNLAFRGFSANSYSDWRKIWHDGNLTDPATQTWVEGNYFKIGGYTSVNSISYSGDLNLLTNAVVYASSGNSGPFGRNGTVLSARGSSGYGWQLGGRAAEFGHRILENGVWSDWREIWHDGNLRSNSQNDSRYVLKSGDTMTGRLTLDNANYGEHLRLFRGTYRADITMGANGHLALEANDYLLAGLSGTGTRMVTANASGALGTQAIPTGNATHTGDVTGSTALTIANNAVTHAKYQNIATQRILGRGATGTGNVQELTLGSNLSLSTSGVLSATNTTYSAGTLAQLNAGTNTTNRVWGAKTIADYVKQYTGDNLGLQGVTDIGNWTSNAIDFVNGSNLAFTITNGINGSPHPQAQPTVGVPSIQALNKEFLIVNSSDSFPDFSDKLPHKFGLLDNRASWANSFSFGSDFGFRFGYLPGINGDWMSIGLDTQLHHTERLANATYTPAGGGYYNQRLHFPPENNATLATREWVLEGDSGTTPPTGDPSIGLVWDTVYRNYRLRSNFTFDHVNKVIDAVDTTYSGSTSITLTGSSFRRAALTGDVTAAANSNATTIANNAVTHAKYQNIASKRILGRGASGTGNVQELTLGSNLSLSTGGVLSATNTTYSQHTLAQLRAGTSSTNRLTNPNFIHTFVKEEVLPKSVITSSAYNIDGNDNGKTIIITGNVGVNVYSTPTYSEFYLVNHTGGSRPIYPDTGLIFNVYGTNTTGTCHVKAWGTAIVIRLNASTYLLKGDVGTGAN